jgi:hypothetical protein
MIRVAHFPHDPVLSFPKTLVADPFFFNAPAHASTANENKIASAHGSAV